MNFPKNRKEKRYVIYNHDEGMDFQYKLFEKPILLKELDRYKSIDVFGKNDTWSFYLMEETTKYKKIKIGKSITFEAVRDYLARLLLSVVFFLKPAIDFQNEINEKIDFISKQSVSETDDY